MIKYIEIMQNYFNYTLDFLQERRFSTEEDKKEATRKFDLNWINK